jgi:hypothetical protein
MEALQDVVDHYGELPSSMLNNLSMEVAIKTLIAKSNIELKEKKEVKKEETISDMLTRIRKHSACK